MYETVGQPFFDRCGSGSALIWLSWIRILDGNADPDPDPGTRKLTKMYKETLCQTFQKDFCTYVSMFYELLVTYIKYGTYTVHVKIQLLVMPNSDQAPDPDPHGSASVRLRGSGSVMRLKLDLDPH